MHKCPANTLKKITLALIICFYCMAEKDLFIFCSHSLVYYF